MFNRFFGTAVNEDFAVNCEVTGSKTSLSDTVVLTKINAVIALKNFERPVIDEDEKVIYPSNNDPIKYYSEIKLPSEINSIAGRIFAIVDDEDDIEQSTSVISTSGRTLYSGKQILPMLDYINQYEIIRLPDTMFMSVVDEDAQMLDQTCENWRIPFKSAGKKYRFKRILEEKKEAQFFGYPGILSPGYDVAIGDCSQKNPKGTGYQFKTDNKFININLACNESAVDYCIKNKCVVYYNDFINQGKLRILSAYGC